MHHLLSRNDGTTLSIDTDLWLCVLDLALGAGWKPRGTTSPDRELERGASDGMEWEPQAYFLPRGQRIADEDARELARCSSTALEQVSDEAQPLQGKPFGRRNTLQSLRLAAEGDPVPSESAEAAAEVLSGAPKREARQLIEFLQGGSFTIRPPQAVRR